LFLGIVFTLKGLASEDFGRVDRVVAVVNQDVVTLSDLQWLVDFRGFQVPENSEEQLALFREVLAQLINQRLITSETSRTPFIRVTEKELESFFATYKTRFQTEDEYGEALEKMRMAETDLLRILEAQIAVNKFVQLRFEPFVIVLPNEIQEYYDGEYASDLAEENQVAPPLEVVEETIRQILTVRKTNAQLERWIQTARSSARIHILLSREPSDSPNIPSEFLHGFSFENWRFEEPAASNQ